MENHIQTTNEDSRLRNLLQSLQIVDSEQERFKKYLYVAIALISDRDGLDTEDDRIIAKFANWWNLLKEDFSDFENFKDAARIVMRKKGYGKNVQYAELVEARDSLREEKRFAPKNTFEEKVLAIPPAQGNKLIKEIISRSKNELDLITLWRKEIGYKNREPNEESFQKWRKEYVARTERANAGRA